ncbi:hypothetical protein GCM10009836_26570 [Pseudonocardia ailaonensis]|uniref:Uncharacterized protein n=1 Tax=Pseudonocardia ailaonensis TaxID=367279 RepID=A0ABN2N2U5_9PSEU
MQKTFAAQPYPLWALWTEGDTDEYLGRVVGWIAPGADDSPAYPVVHNWQTGLTEGLHSTEYDLYDDPAKVVSHKGWTEQQVADGARPASASVS